jgi:hypothetical protein
VKTKRKEGRKIDVMEMKALKWRVWRGRRFGWPCPGEGRDERTKDKDKEGPKLKDRMTTIRRGGIEGR